MTVELTTPRSRRAILGAGLGAVAATVATALARPLAVRATDGDFVQVGNTYTASTVTGFDTTAVPGVTALSGNSDSGHGVSGGTTSGTGVFGLSGSGTGVAGGSNAGYGVYGLSSSGIGIYGSSVFDAGLSGVSSASNKAAVLGVSQGASTGVQGYSGTTAPGSLVPPPANTGLFGLADAGTTSVGLQGSSPTGRGGVFKGNLAQLKLTPSSATSHPHSGQRGDLFVDKSGRLWFCKGGTTWKQLA